MELDKLLQYQEIDIQLRRILDSIEKSEDSKTINQAKAEFMIAKKAVEDSERAAESLVSNFNKSKQILDDIDKKLQDIQLIIENNPSGDAGDDSLDLESLKAKLLELESKVSEKRNKADMVIKNYLDANERGRKIKMVHSKAKERQDVLLKSKEKEIAVLKERLSALEPFINPVLMEKYKALTKENKYPAFVDVYIDGKNYSCKGCGISLSQQNSSTLLEQNYCTCESCRRVIIKR